MLGPADRSDQLSLLEQERLTLPRRSDADCIVDIAERLIAELDERPPISLEVVASFRDITEIKIAPLVHSGSLAPTGRHMTMTLSAADTPRRRRFTGFHEVGHTFQPGYREQTLFRCSPASAIARPSSDPEALADVAAAELLMPRAHLKPLTRSAPFAITSVTALADEFEASVQAAAYRFSMFWPEPTLVVVLEPGKRLADRDDTDVEERLRVVSAVASTSWTGGFVPRNKSAVDDGALSRAWAGEIITERTGLDEFGLSSGRQSLEVTARRFDYRRGRDVQERVLAIFRQPGGWNG